MKLIVGLGNPGKEYENSRHNAGFMCVDVLREKLGFPEFKLNKKFSALVSEGEIEGEKALLAKPQTFMNLSGEAVLKILHFYHIQPCDLWIIYDDIDLPLGKIRIRPNGTAGTHNGMKSIIELIGSKEFPRLRIGIESRGIATPKEEDITSFVLHSFLAPELPTLKKTLEEGADALLQALGARH